MLTARDVTKIAAVIIFMLGLGCLPFGWLFVVWFLPFIGAILALLMVTTPNSQNA